MQLLSDSPSLSKFKKPTTNEIKAHIVSQLRKYLTATIQFVQVSKERSHQRRALAQLSADQLKDIGVSRGDAINEASKPFWKP